MLYVFTFSKKIRILRLNVKLFESFAIFMLIYLHLTVLQRMTSPLPFISQLQHRYIQLLRCLCNIQTIQGLYQLIRH